ncbi:MAG: polyhydroxyalkanoic acid system family protein [Thermoanaerobaculia bacterium]|nr:polyhydroxyalkanoic acid system family protein [Thermoanaerobaculia bacterium]
MATSKPGMDVIRPDLDAALKKQFPGGMMKTSWDGDVLNLSGPGAQGTVVLEGGHLLGQATLKPPASMMRAVIEEKVTKALTEAAG